MWICATALLQSGDPSILAAQVAGWWMFFFGGLDTFPLRFFFVGGGGDFKALVMLQDGRFSRNTGKTSAGKMEGNAFYRTPRGGETPLQELNKDITETQTKQYSKRILFGCPNLDSF